MTMFGIIWGTVSIIVLLAFGVGVRQSMSKNMHGIGEGIAIMFPGRTSKPFQGFGRDRYVRFRESDAELLRQEIPEIASISPEYSTWNSPVRLGDKVIKPNITGIIPEYGPMRNILPYPGGRWIDELDLKDRKRVVFLGDELKNFLFGKDENAIGKYVYLGDGPFLVIGVLTHKTQASSYNSRDQDRAFIPASTFSAYYGHRYINNIIYKLHDARLSKQVQNRVYEVLGKKNKFDPTDKQALHIWDTSEMDEFIFYFTLGFNIFLGLIGVMTLTVGGIGLANIMYVVVQERTFEIGIRRSIGAKRRHILGQFLLEAFIIIGIGSVIGFLIAWGIVTLIAMMPFEQYVGDPTIDFGVAFVTVLVLAAVGFVAGIFPARRASFLNVVECLH